MEVKREWTDSEIYISREKRQQSHDREGGEERGREREREEAARIDRNKNQPSIPILKIN